MLQIRDVNVFYGAIQALEEVTLEVNPGEIVAIIGSNGAGKSTLLRTISGLLRPRTGHVSPTRSNDLTGRVAGRDRQARHLPLAGGTPHLHQHERCRRTLNSGRTSGRTSEVEKRYGGRAHPISRA